MRVSGGGRQTLEREYENTTETQTERIRRMTQIDKLCKELDAADTVGKASAVAIKALSILQEAKAPRTITRDELVEVAKSIIVARDGKRDGERRFQDKTIREAYINDAKAAIATLGITVEGE